MRGPAAARLPSHTPTSPLLPPPTWKRIMMCVTRGRRSALSSGCVSTDSTKSPGLLRLSRTRKVPGRPFSISSCSASCPDRCPWYHLARWRWEGVQVRLEAMAWPGEGTRTHLQPEGSEPEHRHRDRQTDPLRLQGPRQYTCPAQLTSPYQYTSPYPGEGRSQDRWALRGPGWPPGGSLVPSKEGQGHLPRPAPCPLPGRCSLFRPQQGRQGN